MDRRALSVGPGAVQYGHDIPLFRLTMKAIASGDWLRRYQRLGLFAPLPAASHGTVSRSLRK